MATRQSGVVFSFNTDVRAVYAPSGAGAYLGQYLSKGEMDRPQLERLGFMRRFSRSRGWPSDEPLMLRGTLDKSWSEVSWSHDPEAEKYGSVVSASIGSPFLERVGGRFYLALMEKGRRRAGLKRLERILGYAIVPQNSF